MHKQYKYIWLITGNFSGSLLEVSASSGSLASSMALALSSVGTAGVAGVGRVIVSRDPRSFDVLAEDSRDGSGVGCGVPWGAARPMSIQRVINITLVVVTKMKKKNDDNKM